MRKMILTSVVVLGASLVLSAQGQGNGKGKGKGNAQSDSSSFSLVMVSDYNANDAPNWGDQVSFQVSTTETTEPQVQMTCYQDGDVVYGALWPITPVLTLSSRAWQGGAANCTAKLYYISGIKTVDIGSIQFNVEG